MESIILISKGVSLATAYSRLCSSKRVERLLNENNRLTSSIHKMVDAEGRSTLLDALNLLNGAQSASQDKVSFYLENAYLKFLHSYNYYKILFDKELTFKNESDEMAFFCQKTNGKEDNITSYWKMISTALNGCYICSYFLKNYKDAIRYLDLSLRYELDVLFRILCDRFDYLARKHNPDYDGLISEIVINDKFFFLNQYSVDKDYYRIMKNMVEIAIEEKLRITKECKYFFLVYEQSQIDKSELDKLDTSKIKRLYDCFGDLMYIIDNKYVIDD